MKPSFGTYFLIVVGLAIFHLSWWRTAFVLIGYYACSSLDEWLVRRSREKAFEYEVEDWQIDQSDPEWESKGNWTRRRLSGSDQMIVTRVIEFIWRIR
jgi:hypothetical protein